MDSKFREFEVNLRKAKIMVRNFDSMAIRIGDPKECIEVLRCLLFQNGSELAVQMLRKGYVKQMHDRKIVQASWHFFISIVTSFN